MAVRGRWTLYLSVPMGLWNIMCILNVHFSTDTNLLQSANVMSLYGGPLVDLLGPPHHVLVLADGEELAGLGKGSKVISSSI